MRRFLAARILLMGFVLFMIATLMFGMFVLLPGDPAASFVEEGLSRKALERQRELWGLDAPLHVQYLRYLGNVATLEFGVSFRAQVPVREVLVEKFLNSIAMMLPALILIMVGGTVIGAYLGWRRGTAVEKTAVLAGLAVESMPSFFAGIVMLMLFSYGLGWLPSSGMGPSGSGGSFVATVFSSDFPRYAALPVLTLAVRGVNGPMLLMRTSMIEIRGSDFLMLLEAKGVSELRIVRHAVRNAILPMITYFGVLIGTLFQGQVLLETVFGWPGIGRAVVDALAARDFPVLQGAFFFTAIVVVGMNLVVDVLYGYLDPRVRVTGDEVRA
ncbi:MAG: ABC transporter permease [Candidatus Rokubacteria bacterium]|nr:ABC transporter permease [Candidatus Rokubacteria bacterium]